MPDGLAMDRRRGLEGSSFRNYAPPGSTSRMEAPVTRKPPYGRSRKEAIVETPLARGAHIPGHDTRVTPEVGQQNRMLRRSSHESRRDGGWTGKCRARHHQARVASRPCVQQPSRSVPVPVATADGAGTRTFRTFRAPGFLPGGRLVLPGSRRSPGAAACLAHASGRTRTEPPGAITRHLDRLGRPVRAVEVDPRTADVLRRRVSPRVSVVEDDLLRHAPPAWPYDLVGNIPSHVTRGGASRPPHAVGGRAQACRGRRDDRADRAVVARVHVDAGPARRRVGVHTEALGRRGHPLHRPTGRPADRGSCDLDAHRCVGAWALSRRRAGRRGPRL